jgi:hypothetical protein
MHTYIAYTPQSFKQLWDFLNSQILQNVLVLCVLVPTQFPPDRVLQSIQQLCATIPPMQTFLQGIKKP